MQGLIGSLTSECPTFWLGMRRGIEKENLRINLKGNIATTPHPKSLGSALKNHYITTDFSEGLIEMVTEPLIQDQALKQLTYINRFVVENLTDELLWPLSMPPHIRNPDDIHIAQYGSSNAAKMKMLYRQGLAQRYGKAMQIIAGVHYNVSFPEALFKWLYEYDQSQEGIMAYTSARYMQLVRNFFCHYPLIVYLFGAAPSCDISSLERHKPAYLQMLGKQTAYGPYATSLRMSDLGYQNPAQDAVTIRYDSVKAYARSLWEATRIPYPEYTAYENQLNNSVIQIENEYYSPIRPKQPVRPGERPAIALCDRGVRYVEVRAVDLNPLQPMGICQKQLEFMDLLLLWCLLVPNALTRVDGSAIRHNVQQVASQGRKADLKICWKGEQVLFVEWAKRVIEQLLPFAQWLEGCCGSTYTNLLEAQFEKIQRSELTPSALILSELQSQRLSHTEFGLAVAQKQALWLDKQQKNNEFEKILQQETKQSLEAQAKLEKEQDQTFEQFLKNYFNQGTLCQQ